MGKKEKTKTKIFFFYKKEIELMPVIFQVSLVYYKFC